MKEKSFIKSYKRLVFDEICANFLVLSKNREKLIKKKKKVSHLNQFYQII